MLWKTGIVEEAQWRPAASPDTVSYSLLRLASRRADIFESVVRGLRVSGVYRTTYRDRFADADEWAGEILARHFPPGRTVVVHDWAASDCLSSAQFARRLFARFPQCSFFASDITLHLVEFRTGREAYIFETNGSPLQYVRPPLVVSLTKFTNYPVNRLATVWALRRSKRLARLLKQCAWAGAGDGTEFSLPPWTVSRIPLVHPEARALERECPAFRILLHSIFSPLETPVDVIRTMNILNPGYFPAPDLARGIVSVYNSLKAGGVWIAGRTTEETGDCRNQVTLMRKDAAGFTVIGQLNGGWREEHMVPFAIANHGAASQQPEPRTS